jgi:hypothetical protein
VYGDWHPKFDRDIYVGVNFDPNTKILTKFTRISDHFAIENQSVIGGEIIRNLKSQFRYNQPIGEADVTIDLVAPLDKTIQEETNANIKVSYKDFFVATDATAKNLVRVTNN